MEYLSRGGGRAVFREGEVVLKYPISQAGLVENRTEAERYLNDQDQNLASCRLLDNGVLEMEYLDNQTFEYACWQSGCMCELYDISDRRVQPRAITCDHDCANCEHNKKRDFSKYADFPSLIRGESRVQCGFDKNGKLKIYDYGSDSAEELRLRNGSIGFYDELAPVLLGFIDDGGKPEDFSNWAREHAEELPKRKGKPDYRWLNKHTREKVCDGTITWT